MRQKDLEEALAEIWRILSDEGCYCDEDIEDEVCANCKIGHQLQIAIRTLADQAALTDADTERLVAHGEHLKDLEENR